VENQRIFSQIRITSSYMRVSLKENFQTNGVHTKEPCKVLVDVFENIQDINDP
jgi:hypothetical protein